MSTLRHQTLSGKSTNQTGWTRGEAETQRCAGMRHQGLKSILNQPATHCRPGPRSQAAASADGLHVQSPTGRGVWRATSSVGSTRGWGTKDLWGGGAV